MKKASPVNRALRPVESTTQRVAPRSRGADTRNGGNLRAVRDHRAGGDPRESRQRRSAGNRPATQASQPQEQPASREQLRHLFDDYHSRDHEQKFHYLEQRVNDAVSELNARIVSQEHQIRSLQSTLDSERSLSQSAVANLKDLFDGNYKVMADISDRYEDSQQSFVDDKASFDRRLEFIQQESLDSTNQLRTAIIQSQDEDRVQLAESLRALADSIDRKDRK